MISRPALTWSIIGLLLQLVQAQQVFQLDESQLLAAAASQQQQQRHRNAPGHYEFEMAPQMEPPTVRKPPYLQATTTCPGSDLFAGFSPRDTLCGDLNQGRVPLNPLGQSVADQSYPFEVIKNKTLQFLARALPVLKLEYETIPKVARYLPDQHQHQLLNPTHTSSSLTSDQMELLNRRLGYEQPLRRRRRSPSAHFDPSARSANVSETPSAQLGVITKDGYKPISASQQAGARSWPALAQRDYGGSLHARTWAPASIMQTSGSLSVHSARPGVQVVVHSEQPSSNGSQQEQIETNKLKQSQIHATKQNIGGQIGNNAGSNDRENGSVSSALDKQAVAQVDSQSAAQLQLHNSQTQSQLQLHSSAPSPAPSHSQQHQHHQPQVQPQVQPQQVANLTSTTNTHAIEQRSSEPNNSAKTAKQQDGQSRRRLTCADSANGFTSAICQAASALIEPSERGPPAWLSLVRQLGGAGEPASGPLAQGSLWSLLGALMQDAPPPSSAKSASATPTRSTINMLSLLGSLLMGGPPASERSPSSEPQKGAQLADRKEPQSLGAALAGSTMARLALAGWASNALAGLLDYFLPSAASRTFAKRKKPFDPQETFVDTPASLAALRQPAGLAGATKQPPTPCPSVEEYISPTFARNYQGAWKYVVQIPHEGYFTQTIQRTSCARQRCEFTEGVCHESPRWVSLLVAEIYYPNAVFGAAPASGTNQPELVAPAPSTSSIQRATGQQSQHQIRSGAALDPLQMTDSLSTYNQNLYLNSLANSAPDWDQQQNQQLAAYNYQLLQRQGHLPPAPIESRSSNSQQQATQYSNEYIAALAAAALQQNPHLNVNDLLASLQLHYQPSALTRQRRDLAQVNGPHQRRSHAVSGLPAESPASLNELGQQVASSANQQQLTNVYKSSVSGDQHQPDQTPATSSTEQTSQECDGHDKIGCYVVRVYYDWFLVNGSCKCWKTSAGSNSAGSSQSSAAGNSFLRRIFTG